MQVTGVPNVTSSNAAASALTMFAIVYPDSFEDEVVEILDRLDVPGFTEVQKVIGRGIRGRHYDSQVWPGADGMIYVVVGVDQSAWLKAALQEFSRAIEQRSKGLFGLHVFTWPCDQVI